MTNTLRSFLFLLLIVATTEATSMRGSRLARGFGTGGMMNEEVPPSKQEDVDLVQNEVYWGMEEMHRYNTLRGSWPVRGGEEEDDETGKTPPPVVTTKELQEDF